MKQKKKKQLYFTVYKTTNLVNGKIYIGKHITEDPNDRYLGSGHLFYEAVRKYGVKNFKKEVLFIFDNEKEMLDKERELVNEEFIKDDSNYNLIVGGTGNFTRLNGNTGTNNKLIELNSKPWIWICNPAIGIRKKILNRFSLSKEEIAAGWEYGSLSKANLIQVDYNGEKISIKMLAYMHKLDCSLMMQRHSAGWTVEEMLQIPESFQLYKSEDQKATAKKAAEEHRRKQKNLHKIAFQKHLAEEAQRYYKEYIELGQKGFRQKYSSQRRHYLYRLFAHYVKEYKLQHQGTLGHHKIEIEYNGKTQTLKKWTVELGLSYAVVHQMHSAGMPYEKIFSLLKNYPQRKDQTTKDNPLSQRDIAKKYLNENQQS